MRMYRSLLAAGAFLLVACSDGDGGVNSGVDDSKQLGQLTPAERQQLCRATLTYANQKLSRDQEKEIVCKVYGLLAAADRPMGQRRAACQTAVDACKMMTYEQLMLDSRDPATECSNVVALSGTCTATVSEYEKCATDAFNSVLASVKMLPGCAQLDSSNEIPTIMETPPPASCQTVTQKCPEAELPFVGR